MTGRPKFDPDDLVFSGVNTPDHPCNRVRSAREVRGLLELLERNLSERYTDVPKFSTLYSDADIDRLVGAPIAVVLNSALPFARAGKALQTWKVRAAGSRNDFVGYALKFEKKVDELLSATPPYRVKNGRRDQWKKHGVAEKCGWEKSTADGYFNHAKYGHLFKPALDKLSLAPKPPKSSGKGRRTT